MMLMLLLQIDKKSLLKCLKALESVHLIRVYETTVVAESIENKVVFVICFFFFFGSIFGENCKASKINVG